jgi:hypothetical protein
VGVVAVGRERALEGRRSWPADDAIMVEGADGDMIIIIN